MDIICDDAFGINSPLFFNQTEKHTEDYFQKNTDLLGRKLQNANHLPNYTWNLNTSKLDEIFVYGRIYGESPDDQDEAIFSLETLNIFFTPSFKKKKQLHFKLNCSIPPYLFLGQVIAARGYIYQDDFIATEIFYETREQRPKELSPTISTSILIVSGPYADSQSDFEQIHSLNEKIKLFSPDLVIFLGPFALSESELLNSKTTDYCSRELTEKVTSMLTDQIFCPIVTIGSDLDALAIPVYPRPSLTHVVNPSFNTGDPSFVTINGLSIMATTFDPASYIQNRLISENLDLKSVLAEAAVRQTLFFPGMSPSLQPQYLENIIPSNTPHLFVASSSFDYAKTIDGTTIVFTQSFAKAKNFFFVTYKGNDVDIQLMNVFE